MADSSIMNSEDVLQQINEQTSQLVEGGGQEEAVEEEVLAPVEEESQETVGEETQETSEQEQAQEETKEASEAEEQTESSLRIKYKGKDIEIPKEKIVEYAQKGYRYEEKVKELKDQFQQQVPKSEQIDFSKIDEEFVAELQKSPVKTLMQFTKTILESTEKERTEQRKVDRAIEKEFSANVPIWDAIREEYQDYRSAGHDPATALKLAQGDFFTSQYFESKQKGVEEGVHKQILKQKAAIPSSSKKGATTSEPSLKDIKGMTSTDLAKAMGIPYVKHPDW